MSLKKKLRSIGVMLSGFGFNVLKIRSIKYFPRYIGEIKKYKNLGGKISNYFPVLSEWGEQAGSSSGHYFHQDLLVAKYIFEANPVNHVDVGSRIDGFVAHVASYRDIYVVDVRELKQSIHKNIKFIRADFMGDVEGLLVGQKIDSVSSLHALEHFGLGRYGDPLDPEGHIKGFINLTKMLDFGGKLYIGLPVAKISRTYFNAHRVFNPNDIFAWIDRGVKLKLERFDFVDDSGELHLNIKLDSIPSDTEYGCGIYTFIKEA